MPVPGVNHLHFVAVSQDDPLAAPLLAELASEYAQRYGGTESAIRNWPHLPRGGVRAARRWAADRPSGPPPPHGQPVTGGAFRRFDDATAELKRIWTDSRHRRLGHAKALLAQLEAEIAGRGYGASI